MQDNNRKIDWYQFLVYLWENKWKVLITACLCAVCMIAWGNKRIHDNSANAGGSLSSIMNQNREAYYKMTDKSIFTDAKKPSGTYNSYARVYIDFDFNKIVEKETFDYTQLTEAMGYDVWNVIRKADTLQHIIDALDLHAYSDMKTITPDELSWLINSNLLGMNTINIVVTDVNPERAHDIAVLVVEEFLKNADNYLKIDGISTMDEPSMPKEIEASLVKMTKKDILKYGLAGVFAAVIVMSLILLLFYIMNPKLRTAGDVAHLEWKIFDKIEKKDKVNAYKRISYRLNALLGESNLIIADIDGKNDLNEMVDRIKEVLHEEGQIQLMRVDNCTAIPETVKYLKDNDAILFTGTYGKTSLDDIDMVAALLSDVQIRNLGIIMVK